MSRSVINNRFAVNPSVNVERSVFKRPSGHTTTFDPGFLIPLYVDEVLPGDTRTISPHFFARTLSLKVPFMDNAWFDWHAFFVPNRLLWENWQRFCGEQSNPGDSTDYLVPQVSSPVSTGWSVHSLADYFGQPIGFPSLSLSALPFRAYNLVWNEWYRDQNLQDSVTVSLDDGPDDPADYVLLKRGKRHDYFTSCLPWPQKGPGVEIPLGGTAPVYGDASVPMGLRRITGSNVNATLISGGAVGSGQALVASGPTGTDGAGTNLSPKGSAVPSAVYADLTDATAATINQLREAFQIQRLFERDARGGTRYTEILRSHFGVISPDSRLQRPELLASGSVPIHQNIVPQTSESGTTAQANLSSYGVINSHRGGFNQSFVEHGWILILGSVRADLRYQQGIDRQWSRRTRFDYYWPSLAHLGEQAVLNKEIFYQGTDEDSQVFGYQERYSEYRYKKSIITGKMRSSDPQSLDFWHLAQDFADLPTLSPEFIEEDPPFSRVVAVPSEPIFKVDCFFEETAVRPMPVYGIPGLIDHF